MKKLRQELKTKIKDGRLLEILDIIASIVDEESLSCGDSKQKAKLQIIVYLLELAVKIASD